MATDAHSADLQECRICGRMVPRQSLVPPRACPTSDDAPEPCIAAPTREGALLQLHAQQEREYSAGSYFAPAAQITSVQEAIAAGDEWHDQHRVSFTAGQPE